MKARPSSKLIAEGRVPRLVDFCERFCLENKILEPTRVTGDTKSLIDVALTGYQERFVTSGTLQLGVSDHYLIFVVRKNKLPRPRPRFLEYRSLKNFDLAKFLSDLKEVSWGTAYTYDNADNVRSR